MFKTITLFFMFSAYLFAEAHILLYHRFDDSRERVKGVNISSSGLRDHLSYLKKNGYKVVKLSDLVEKIKNKKPIEEKTVVLTIDDAYDSFYKHGLSVFREFGVPFTLFVYVDAVDNHYKDYMSWDEVKDSAKYGEIALHSFKHPNLTALSEQEVKNDTKSAYDLFVSKMGYKPKYYAYPFGKYDYKVKNAIASFGFDGIFNVDSGAVDSYYDHLNLDRIALDGSSNLPQLLKVKPLQLDLKINQSGNKIAIKGKIQNSKTKSIFVRVSQAKIFNIKTPNGEFEVSFGKEELNSKRKIAFFTEDHRQFTKLLDKE